MEIIIIVLKKTRTFFNTPFNKRGKHVLVVGQKKGLPQFSCICTSFKVCYYNIFKSQRFNILLLTWDSCLNYILGKFLKLCALVIYFIYLLEGNCNTMCLSNSITLIHQSLHSYCFWYDKNIILDLFLSIFYKNDILANIFVICGSRIWQVPIIGQKLKYHIMCWLTVNLNLN